MVLDVVFRSATASAFLRGYVRPGIHHDGRPHGALLIRNGQVPSCCAEATPNILRVLRLPQRSSGAASGTFEKAAPGKDGGNEGGMKFAP